MARGINKVILIGNLGRDPETRYTQGGSAVTNLRVATAESWKDKQTGEQQERTEWHSVVCFARNCTEAAPAPPALTKAVCDDPSNVCAVPVAVTEKVAVWPAVTDALTGCEVIAGAAVVAATSR